MPYSYAIDDHAVTALRGFVRKGGTLWADGLTAWKNEYEVIKPGLPDGLNISVKGCAYEAFFSASPMPVNLSQVR